MPLNGNLVFPVSTGAISRLRLRAAPRLLRNCVVGIFADPRQRSSASAWIGGVPGREGGVEFRGS